MLDANLELALSDAVSDVQTIDAMNELIKEYEGQFDPDKADSFISKLRDELGADLGNSKELFSVGEGQDDTGLGELEDIFERVRSAAMQIVEDYRVDLKNLVSDNLTVIGNEVDDHLTNHQATLPAGVQTQLNDLADAGKVVVNGTPLTTAFTFYDFLSSSGPMTQMLGDDPLWPESGDIAHRVEIYLNQLSITYNPAYDPANPDASFTPADFELTDATKAGLQQLIIEGWNAALDSKLDPASINALQHFALKDVTVTGGAKLISYAETQDLTDPSAPVPVPNSVTVTVDLAQINTLLDNLDADPALKTVLPVDFQFPTTSGTFSFDLAASTVTDTIGLEANNFSLTNELLFGFGDPATGVAAGDPVPLNYTKTYTDEPEMSVGFLTGQLTQIETAEFGVFATGLDGLDYALAVKAGPDAVTAPTVVTNTVTGMDNLEFVIQVDEIDGSALQDVDLTASVQHDLVRYTIATTLPTTLGDIVPVRFDLTLTQAGSFSSLAGGTAVQSGIPQNTNVALALKAFDDSAQPFTSQQLLDLAQALHETTSETFTQFLGGVSDSINGFLTSNDFQLGVPLVDIDVATAFSGIADIFANIPAQFAITATDLGFIEGSREITYFTLSDPALPVTGLDLSDDGIARLVDLKTLSLNIYPGFVNSSNAGAGESTGTPTKVNVDLSTITPRDEYGVIATDFMAQFAAALNTALASYGWAVTASTTGRGITFAQGGSTASKLFVIDEATDLNDNAKTLTLADFGVPKFETITSNDDAENTIEFLDVDPGRATIELATLNTDLLKGLSTLAFNVTIDGVKTKVEVQQPTNGWGDLTSGTTPLEGLTDSINAAFSNKGIDVQASQNTAGDGLKFDLLPGSESRYQIGIDPETLTRAQDLKGFMAWITNELKQTDCMPDLTFSVDVETGEFKLTFVEPMEKTVAANGSMNLSDAGLGELDDVNLEATLAGSIVAQLDMAAGFNIFDIQTQYNADPTAEHAIRDAVLDNTFLTDLNLNAVLDVSATNLVASAALGMIEVGIGTDPDAASTVNTSTNANFVRVNTEIDLTVVGQDDGDFSDKLSATQMLSIAKGATVQTDPVTGAIIRDPDGNAIYDPVPAGARLSDLVGRAEVIGGIAVDDKGCPVDATGQKIEIPSNATSPAALLTTASGTDRVAGHDYAMAVFNFEAPTLNLSGLTLDPNLLSGIDTTMMASVGNLFDPLGTTKLCYDLDEVLCLTLLDPNRIVDALTGFSALLEAYSDSLNNNFSALNIDVPLLNASLLSSFDFISDFNAAMDEVRKEGNFSYATINDVLERHFGENTVTIKFNTDGGACELLFDLNLEYLKDATQKVPFNFGLKSLLGETGLTNMLNGTGASELVGVLTNFVDARADAELVLDPLLGLNLSLGIDLAALAAPETDLAVGSTELTNLASVTALATQGLGQDDLRIDWSDETANTTQSYLFDFDKIIVDANQAGDTLDLDYLLGVINSKLDNGLSITFEDGAFKLVDPNATATDPAGVSALFGTFDPTAAPVTTQIELAASFDAAAAYKFGLNIAETVVQIEIEAEAGRDRAGLADALNAALLQTFIGRDAISDTAMFKSTVAVSQMLRLNHDAASGDMTLIATNFATLNGFDPVAFKVLGNDTSHDITFTVSELGKSNVARALGFTPDKVYDGDATADEVRVKALGLDTTGVTALFGGSQFEPEAAAADPAQPYQPRDINLLAAGNIDFADGFDFGLTLGEASAVKIVIAEDAGRDHAGFIAAFNAALAAKSISLTAINPQAASGATVAVSALLEVTETAGQIKLATTDYAQQNTLKEFAFGVAGNADPNVTFTRPIVFIDTEKTGISAELKLGTPDGLNMVLALGPLEASIEKGSAFLGASGGEGRGYIKGVLQDVDDTPDDGRYDVLDLYEISQETNPNYLKLFGLDVDFETRIDLPFSGAFGLLDPTTDGFVYESTLLRTIGDPNDPNNNVVSADEIEAAYSALSNPSDKQIQDALLTFFEGDAKALVQDHAVSANLTARPADVASGDPLPADYYDAGSNGAPYGPHFYELTLPSAGLFDCSDIIDLINDPLAIVNGLDSIMGTIQGFVDDYMDDIDLPLIGDNLAAGAGFFNDVRFDVLDGARTYLEQPKSDGELPTTVDLVNDFLNSAFNLIIDPEDNHTDSDLIAVAIGGDGSDPYLYGALAISQIVFDVDLDVGFDLDIPGLNLNVDSGSAINLTSQLNIDLGFGIDCNGFFLLNDTTTPEATLEFTAAANDFRGNFNVGGVLDVSATAAKLNDSNAGETSVTAMLGIQLYGDSGTDASTGDVHDARDYDFSEGALTNLTLKSDRDFDKTVYVSQINFQDFAEFTFDAQINANLDLVAAFTAVPNVVPSVLTTFVLEAEFDPKAHGSDLLIKELRFDKISLDVSTLKQIVNPVLTPVMNAISPITQVINGLDKIPLSFAFDAFKTAFPILNVVAQLDAVMTEFDRIANTPGGKVCLGDYNFLGTRDTVLMSKFDPRGAIFTPCLNITVDFSASGSAAGPGLEFAFPLLTDPSQGLNLLLGKFDQVDLVTATFRLLEADFNLDIAAQVLHHAGVPGWASSAIRGGFSASVAFDLKAGLEVGYDLSGIVNFANSLDSERLLDGVFIDAAPGALVSGHIDGNVRLNAGIAGASGGIGGNISLTFNDPNSDGKLRIPELIKLTELAGKQSQLDDVLGAIFQGSVDASAYLRIWAGINLPWPLPDLRWAHTVFDETFFKYSLPKVLPPPEITEIASSTALLNVGARAGGNLSTVTFDGNDVVKVSGNGHYTTQYHASGQYFGNSHNTFSGVSGIIIPAGEGNNTVDLTGITNSTATVTYTGKGNDIIKLPRTGTHVVFAGAGSDRITVAPNATGNYYIFAEEGADNVNITTTGKTIVFADDDLRMREYFKSNFKSGGLTQAAIETAINGNNYSVSNVNQTLAQVKTGYTAATQSTAGRDIETIEVGGSGHHVILTGKGDDLITVKVGAGNADVYAGAGDDEVRLNNAATNMVEAGAGDDLVVATNGSANTVYGWGKQVQPDQLNMLSSAEQTKIVHLARADGDDILIGNSGADAMFGQYGKDLIGGGAGNDTLDGGHENDFVSGGDLIVTAIKSGKNIDLSKSGALNNLQTRLIVETAIAADGVDNVFGGSGNDVLFGGGGDDDMVGGTGSDILVGDYGTINVSANRMAETFVSTGMNDASGGRDTLNGGFGNDILVAGGASVNADPAHADNKEVITDTQGNNIVFGDFGITEGSRILENVTAFRAIASNFGTLDEITTGNGNDVIIGGEQADTITTGLGGDVVIADLGSFVPAQGELNNDVYVPPATPAGTGTVVTNTSTLEGDDVINLGGTTPQGDLIDIVLGGGGADKVMSQDGGVIFIGDYGQMNLNPPSVSALFDLKPLPDVIPTDPAGKAEYDKKKADYDEKVALIERIFSNMTTIDQNGAPLGDNRSGNDSLTTASGTVYAILGGGGDTANLGDGLSYILTDDGRLGITPKTSTGATPTEYGVIKGEAVSTALAGADHVTTRLGRDIILTGDGNDTIDAGDGINFAMTDNGTLETSDNPNLHPTKLGSVEGVGDGADSYTGGADEDYVVLGGRSDHADVKEGTNYLLSDSGTIDYQTHATGAFTLSLTSKATALGNLDGNDTVISGNENDFIVAGLGADTIDAGEAENRILAGAGTLTFARTAGGDTSLNMMSQPVNPLAVDGNDTVTTGTGDAYVILGLGSDDVNIGTGTNHIVGGAGFLNSTTTAAGAKTLSLGSQTVNPLAIDGVENITTGDGNDFIVLGLGADTAHAGQGTNHIIGGAGTITFNQPVGGDTHLKLESQAVNASARDGAETITTGDDDDFVILGLGNDTVHAGNGQNHVIGGVGSLTFDVTAARGKELVMDARPVDPLNVDGDDSVTTGSDDDFVVLGLGADTATAGDGINRILAGAGGLTFNDDLSGNTSLEIKSQNVNPAAMDGDDTVTAGSGDTFVVLGLGSDHITAGAGSNHLIGGAGTLQFDQFATGATRLSLASQSVNPLAVDGNENITTGNGNDFIVLGLGADAAMVGEGVNMVVGTAGTITAEKTATGEEIRTLGSQAVNPLAVDGNDTVTSGNDEDFVILGLGDDETNVGHGNNRVLGDAGEITYNSATGAESVVSTNLDFGGNDSVTAGTGDDIIVLGLGNDTATASDGDDIVTGDNASIVKQATGDIHALSAFATGGGGDDSIDGGAGNDILVGGLGSDDIQAGTDEDFVLGDVADLTFRNVTDIVTLTYTDINQGGNDTITATGAGDNILIGQAGSDTITGGQDDDWLVGDLADMTFTNVLVAAPGQSALDRLQQVTFTGPGLKFDDLLIGQNGHDFLMGGFGGDTLQGGADQDFLFGDTIQMTRTISGSTNIETILAETNFAFLQGGYDIMQGGTGPDVLVGGLGPDLFFGNSASKLLIGDGFAGTFESARPIDFLAETPERKLYKVNFAGHAAVDILSSSQIRSAIGVMLSTDETQSDREFGKLLESGSYIGVNDFAKQASALATLEKIEEFFDDEEVVQRISELVYFGIDSDLIHEDMLRSFELFLNASTNPDATIEYLLFKMFLQELIQEAEESSQSEANATSNPREFEQAAA